MLFYTRLLPFPNFHDNQQTNKTDSTQLILNYHDNSIRIRGNKSSSATLEKKRKIPSPLPFFPTYDAELPHLYYSLAYVSCFLSAWNWNFPVHSFQNYTAQVPCKDVCFCVCVCLHNATMMSTKKMEHTLIRCKNFSHWVFNPKLRFKKLQWRSVNKLLICLTLNLLSWNVSLVTTPNLNISHEGLSRCNSIFYLNKEISDSSPLSKFGQQRGPVL